MYENLFILEKHFSNHVMLQILYCEDHLSTILIRVIREMMCKVVGLLLISEDVNLMS